MCCALCPGGSPGIFFSVWQRGVAEIALDRGTGDAPLPSPLLAVNWSVSFLIPLLSLHLFELELGFIDSFF